MNLSAFGVESDYFPSIDVLIDFSKNESVCLKSFYNPDVEGSTYWLSMTEMKEILELLNNTDLKKIES